MGNDEGLVIRFFSSGRGWRDFARDAGQDASNFRDVEMAIGIGAGSHPVVCVCVETGEMRSSEKDRSEKQKERNRRRWRIKPHKDTHSL